ncbi:hypothetical protein HXX76_011870 [Chlamydomonas incerta]|uniref:Protein kinase domain-containing protein n=1 Tax=Chlamydomonas incerta TaxID=51695 RepID=A0A835SWN5_CHLIN|nr:hypothetical protein HXX76_011870 [Chlamydomonas incerta]|eukprot:KAG2428190.1 hypothetical protein HXX76_011870 [Chlamydomonas incerta]
MPFALAPQIFIDLSVESPDQAQNLVVSIRDVISRTPQAQETWDVWTWDDRRTCRCLSYINSVDTQPGQFFLTDTRPCSYVLTYICLAESAIKGAGFQSSTDWYKRYRATPEVQPPVSPFVGGPAGSGLTLVTSSLVIGNPAPVASPAGLLVSFDETAEFWAKGPPVTSLYRTGNSKLLALRPIREEDVRLAYGYFANQTQQRYPIIQGSFGQNAPYSGTTWPPNWEVINVIAGLNDYFVRVQGCYRATEVETLFLTTRTGRMFQMGRGGCTNWFSEDAPAGGYLAGFSGVYMNATAWAAAPAFTNIAQQELAWLPQLRLIWAAPAGAGAPTTVLRGPAALPSLPPPSCPTALATTRSASPFLMPECGGTGSASPFPLNPLCPSNACCGGTTSVTANGTSREYRFCDNTLQTCQLNCLRSFGLCNALPERPLVQFLRSQPEDLTAAMLRSNATASAPTAGLFIVRQDSQQTYTEARDWCSASTHMGLSWSLPSVPDVLSWLVAQDVRREAYQALAAGGYFWLQGHDDYIEAVANSDTPDATVCLHGSYALVYGKDSFTNFVVPVSCIKNGMTVCRASPSQNASALPLLARTPANASATANVTRWTPGYHVLSLSRRLGSGPFSSGSCAYTVGVPGLANASNPNATTAATTATTLAGAALVVPAHLGSIAVSAATQVVSEPTDPVSVLAALRLLPFGGGAAEAAGALAGTASTGGWDAVELAPGEVVTAVSGCTGGFVERLVFHTSAGRLWTSSFSPNSLCSVPFLEYAPAGAYLLGLTGSVGSYIESTQLVWGRPQLAPPPPASPPLPPSPAPRPPSPSPPPLVVFPAAPVDNGTLQQGDPTTPVIDTGSSSDSSNAVALGVGIGVGVGCFLLILAGVAGYFWWRRRAAAAGAAAGKAGEYDGTGAVIGNGKGNGSGPAGVSTVHLTIDDGPADVAGTPAAVATGGNGAAAAAVAGAAAGVAAAAAVASSASASQDRSGGAGQVQGSSSGVLTSSAAATSADQTSSTTGTATATGTGTGANSSTRTGSAAGTASPAIPLGGASAEAGAGATAAAAAAAATAAAAAAAKARQLAVLPADLSDLSSFVTQVEDKLSAYIKAGATIDALDDDKAEGPPAAAAAAGAGGAQKPGVPGGGSAAVAAAIQKTDISAAISKLHAELSGRQEQLRITTVLGKGSFGVVYMGTWRGLRVAVKTLVVHDALLGREGRQRHRAILEAAISKSLQHPHCISTYAAEVMPLAAVDPSAGKGAAGEGSKAPGERNMWDGVGDVYKLYIIQEFADVGTLTAALGAGVVGSVSVGGAAALCALTLALDVACGMFHIHSKNIVHGDLSSSNVLLASCLRGPDGRPEVMYDLSAPETAARQPLEPMWRPPVIAKVADFGLSVPMAEDQTHASNRFAGTPAYAAPEVRTLGRMSKAADVYAFGVLLLEFFHGIDISVIRANAGAAPLPADGAAAGDATATAADGADAEAAAAAAADRLDEEGMPMWAAPPAGCPPELVALVRECLSPEPAARPSFGKVIDVLVQVLYDDHVKYQRLVAAAMAGGQQV